MLEPKSVTLWKETNRQLYRFRTDLEGQILTLIEAIIPNKEQCEAAKSIFRRILSESLNENSDVLNNYIEAYIKAVGEWKPQFDSPRSKNYFNASYLFENCQSVKIAGTHGDGVDSVVKK